MRCLLERKPLIEITVHLNKVFIEGQKLVLSLMEWDFFFYLYVSLHLFV